MRELHIYHDVSAKWVKANGMKAIGWEYINLDDCWVGQERTSEGKIQPDAGRFPRGLQPVIEHVHSLGLRFGLYTSVGDTTCNNHGHPVGQWVHRSPGALLLSPNTGIRVDGHHQHIPVATRTFKIFRMSGVQDVETPIREDESAALRSQARRNRHRLLDRTRR